MNTIEQSNALAAQLCAPGTNYRYIYGAKDERYTTALVNKFAKLYPQNFTSSILKSALSEADNGYMAIDCSGFVCKVLGIPNKGSGQLKSSAVKVLPVKKENAREGMAIWKNGHIAYVGKGLNIYEAASTKTDMKVSTWDARAKDFTYLLVVKGSALAEKYSNKVILSGSCPLPTMRKGAKGYQVELLQKALNALGYVGANGKALAVDGQFGKNTEFALKAFQRDFSLEVDGIYGKLSYAELCNLY